MIKIQLFLGFPPTINNYYVRTRRGVFISKKGRIFRETVASAVNEQLGGVDQLDGRLAVTVILSSPDKRKRDVDNYMKALLDAITHAGVWEDDSQIDQLFIYRAKTKTLQGLAGCIVLIDSAGPVFPANLLASISDEQ